MSFLHVKVPPHVLARGDHATESVQLRGVTDYALNRIALAFSRAGHEVYGTTRSAESAKKLEAEESEYRYDLGSLNAGTFRIVGIPVLRGFNSLWNKKLLVK